MTHLHQPTIHAHCSFGWLFVTRKKLCQNQYQLVVPSFQLGSTRHPSVSKL